MYTTRLSTAINAADLISIDGYGVEKSDLKWIDDVCSVRHLENDNQVSFKDQDIVIDWEGFAIAQGKLNNESELQNGLFQFLKTQTSGLCQADVADYQACILRNLENLQEGSKFQPGWGGGQSPDTFGWPRHGGK